MLDALTLIAAILLSTGVVSFYFKRKEKKLRDEISKQKRKVFDMEIEHINRRIDDIAIEDLVRDDEEIIRD